MTTITHSGSCSSHIKFMPDMSKQEIYNSCQSQCRCPQSAGSSRWHQVLIVISLLSVGLLCGCMTAGLVVIGWREDRLSSLEAQVKSLHELLLEQNAFPHQVPASDIHQVDKTSQVCTGCRLQGNPFRCSVLFMCRFDTSKDHFYC